MNVPRWDGKPGVGVGVGGGGGGGVVVGVVPAIGAEICSQL